MASDYPNAGYVDYDTDNGARDDDVPMADRPYYFVSQPPSPTEDDFELLLRGTTDPDAENLLVDQESTMSGLSRAEDMDCDAPASNRDINWAHYDDFQLFATQAPTTLPTDPNDPDPPHSNPPLLSQIAFQDAGVQTGMGMWAEPLPVINVQTPKAMTAYGQQDPYRGDFQTDGIAAYPYGHETIVAPARNATDNMQSIPFLWAEAGTRTHNATPNYSESAVMFEQTDSTSPYPPPWNNIDPVQTQNVFNTQSPCDCLGTSRHVPPTSSQSVSTARWTEASASSYSLVQQDLTDSTVTVRQMPAPGQFQHVLYCQHGNPIMCALSESDRGSAYDAQVTSAQLEGQQSYTGGGPSSQRDQLSVPGIANTVSSVSSPISPTPSCEPDVLHCPDCGKQYSGKCRRGTLQRHARLKHGPEERDYPCGINGCRRNFARQDARLKHYRKHHPGLNLPAPSTRPRRS